jgi:hypothetical protein
MSPQQLHKRLSDEQARTILTKHVAGQIGIEETMANLGLRRARFFRVLKRYKDNPHTFTLAYGRSTPNYHISPAAEQCILAELGEEKKLIDNKNNPIATYNYSAVTDLLQDKHQLDVSASTIRRRAKQHGFYLPKKLHALHTREVLTNFVGELVQHDASHHQWSPYMAEKLFLITSLDDYSRRILFADFFLRETAWVHIMALQSAILQFGCPLKYYTDQHSIFRYVKDRDTKRIWTMYTKFTDDVDTQWKAVLKACGVEAVYALSPQAKGKIERPYRWLQDRIVRIAAKERLTKIEELRAVLRKLVETYNTQWVHSTTKEIPIVRFENALNPQQCLFRPLRVVKPDQDVKDIFCLRARRVVNGYRKISFDGMELAVPNGTPGQVVDLKLIPDMKHETLEVRFWQPGKFLGSQLVPLSKLTTVYF